jgi:hypothetical protein
VLAGPLLRGLELEAELPGQAGGRQLRRTGGQAEVLKDSSHDGELGDVGDDRERAAALGAVQSVGEAAGDQLGPRDAATGWPLRRSAEAGDGLSIELSVGVRPGVGGGAARGASRNEKNVLAVRGAESRELWTSILDYANTMAMQWSKGTTLGTAARYVINHFDELTAYLDDPRLEPSNTLCERMLRTEKLIEGSALFRKTLEGRFVLDVVRTILQTAVAAGAPAHEYLVSVLRTSEDEIAEHPERFTPPAWVAANADAATPTPE